MEQFLGVVFGALVSALIGILAVYLTERMHRQAAKKENIYKPLYNELCELLTAKRPSLPEEFSTKWTTLDHYTKLVVDKEAREAFSAYEDKIHEYNKLNEKYSNILENSLDPLVEAVAKALRSLISTDNKSIILERHNGGDSSIDIKTWTRMFREFLLTCRSGRKLYENLVDYSEGRRLGHDKFFKKWYAETPEIFDNLAKECLNVVHSKEHETIHLKIRRERAKIVEQAAELRKKLEKEIK